MKIEQLNVVRRVHPRGEAGTRISLEEAAERAAEGRLEPKVRAWAIEKLVQAGNPKTVPEKAAAILEGLRRERIYVPDPVDAEFIPSAACTLDGCYGLKFLGEDCDGLLVAFLAACLSVGLDGAVVGHGYPDDSGQLSHVLGAVYDPKANRWLLGDPSTSQPFGVAHAPARERWIHAVTGRLLCDTTDGTCKTDGFASDIRANIPDQGTFVGVGAPFGQLGEPATPLDPATLWGLDDVGAQSSMAKQVLAYTSRLKDSLYSLILGHTEMSIIRQEYLDRPIADPDTNTVPPPQGVWTESEEDYYQNLLKFTRQLITYGDQAGSGVRPVAWDVKKNEIVIIGKPGEPSLSMTPNGDMSISDLPGQDVATIPSVYGGTVGIDPITFGILMAMAFIGTYVIADRILTTVDNRTNYAKQTDLTTFHQRVYDETGSNEQADKSTAAMAEAVAKKAKAEADKAAAEEKPFQAIADIAKGAAYAGLALGAIYIGGRLILEVLPYFRKDPKLIVTTDRGRQSARA